MPTKQLPNSPRKFRSLSDLPPEKGLEEAPLFEVPGLKELKRKALGSLKDAGVPEVAVEAADVLVPDGPDMSAMAKKAGKAMKAMAKSEDKVKNADYEKAQEGHRRVREMLGLDSSAPDMEAKLKSKERVLDYGNFDKDPTKRIPRTEVKGDDTGKLRTLENEALTQDRMESLERLKERNPDRYQKVIAKWRAKGILPDQGE